MKKTVVALALAWGILPLSGEAQLRLSVLGGPQKATVQESNDIPGWDSTAKPFYKGRNGFHLGVLVEVPLGSNGKWFLHPGIMYSAKGRSYFKRNSDETATQTDTISLGSTFQTNYIDIPFNLAYKAKLGGKTSFILSAGPYLAFFYNGKQTAETRLLSSEKISRDENRLEVGNALGKVRTLDYGFNGRVGFEIGNVLLTGFYSKGMANFYSALYSSTYNHQVIGASLGFWLNKPAKTQPVVKDRDKDGVPDPEDECPSVKGTALTHGCPDRDGDGIADGQDQCPDLAGVASKKGCPFVDNDHDGIDNESDKCPDIAGTEAYQGCPVPDTDGDGIRDDADACPDKAGVPEFNGCPVPDSDGDGVKDTDDKCPNTPGTAANNGCPEIKKEIISQVQLAAQNIFFQLNSDALSRQSYDDLDKVAAILKANESLKLHVTGHTDNIGKDEINRELSKRRAQAVKDYLISKGIAADRLQSEGLGSSRPIAPNTTAAGREKNRRVELSLRNN